MPELETNRKRSRSPSPSDGQKQHKRANTGQHLSDASSTSLSAAQILGTDSAPPAPSASSKLGESATANAEDAASSPASASATTTGAASSSANPPPPPSAHIHMRCLIVTQDASIIIGKGGSHVNEIREKSGARVMVSESIPGNPERILNVSGPLDAVSKVCLEPFVLTLRIIDQICQGFRFDCSPHQRRAIRRPLCARQPRCDHKVHDPELAHGLCHRQAGFED